MSEQSPQSHNAAQESQEDKVKWIAVGLFVGIIGSVIALDWYGYIKHPSDFDGATIAEFKLISLNTEAATKVSPKNSGKEAFCANDYLLLRPTNGNEVAGILVDGKKRPVHCRYGFAKSDSEEQYLKKQAEDIQAN
ncbi:hypothetical protein [Bacterioplanoides sp.]|uniref:hypothetical protein n=1 Tax=Bacterioplanoides sp. TaxID=2066072 RepID=UPI003B5A954B